MQGRLALLLLSALLSAPLEASVDFDHYVTSLKQQALAAGIQPATVTAAFADIRLIEAAIKHDKNQPEFKLTREFNFEVQFPIKNQAAFRSSSKTTC
ncbi:lytic murein transglycosylase, partial [Aeromonas rivipollensis]|uniref:lytic murein transglycosylase n=1 Tax=Aeromonas rivipollensis TaxID=948519 RepID=UPI003D200E70